MDETRGITICTDRGNILVYGLHCIVPLVQIELTYWYGLDCIVPLLIEVEDLLGFEQLVIMR